MAIEADIAFKRGESLVIEVSVVDASGLAVDITGWTLKAEVRDREDSPTALITKSTPGASGIQITNAAGGKYEISFAAADTKSLPIRNEPRFWDTWRTDAGLEAQLTYGKFEFREEIYRA